MGTSSAAAPPPVSFPYYSPSIRPEWMLTGIPDFMFYTRGSSDEFDRLARISGDKGWSWKAMLPYILKASARLLLPPPLD